MVDTEVVVVDMVVVEVVAVVVEVVDGVVNTGVDVDSCVDLIALVVVVTITKKINKEKLIHHKQNKSILTEKYKM